MEGQNETKRGPKRKRNERLAHRRQLARWLYEGELTVEDMAEELGVSVQQVYYDIGLLKEQWRQETMQDMEARKDRILAELMMIRRLCMRGWRKSLTDKEKITTGVGKFGPMDSREIEGQAGDPKFLSEYHKTLLTEINLFGLNEIDQNNATLGEVILEALGRANAEDVDLDALEEEQEDKPKLKTLKRQPRE